MWRDMRFRALDTANAALWMKKKIHHSASLLLVAIKPPLPVRYAH